MTGSEPLVIKIRLRPRRQVFIVDVCKDPSKPKQTEPVIPNLKHQQF